MRFGGIAAALVLAGVFGLADAASAQSRSTASSLSLTDAQRAQIEDIVTRKTGIAPENIIISPVSGG